MIARYYGHDVDLNGLRQRFSLSMSGATLRSLMQFADKLGLSARAIRTEPEPAPARCRWTSCPGISPIGRSRIVLGVQRSFSDCLPQRGEGGHHELRVVGPGLRLAVLDGQPEATRRRPCPAWPTPGGEHRARARCCPDRCEERSAERTPRQRPFQHSRMAGRAARDWRPSALLGQHPIALRILVACSRNPRSGNAGREPRTNC
ncbi:cysteine peptidase family C39 domain-containing protein [Brevundimonas sp.]|uniref:cysteine peptidase family C39 domain-containing protein n=1 Tax=Brevundimonas sp. TaxID=1871086 RepID=UPI003519EC95